jgi:hypothetical protein
MLLVQFAQEMTPCLANLDSWNIWHPISQINFHSWQDLAVLAQQFETDVFKGTRTILNDFIKSGKLWTLLIGILIGYVLRGLTSYG